MEAEGYGTQLSQVEEGQRQRNLLSLPAVVFGTGRISIRHDDGMFSTPVVH
jgi:hypothetical protein